MKIRLANPGVVAAALLAALGCLGAGALLILAPGRPGVPQAALAVAVGILLHWGNSWVGR